MSRLWTAIQGTSNTLFTSAADLVRAGQKDAMRCPRCGRMVSKVQRADRCWLAVCEGCHVRLEVWDD